MSVHLCNNNDYRSGHEFERKLGTLEELEGREKRVEVMYIGYPCVNFSKNKNLNKKCMNRHFSKE